MSTKVYTAYKIRRSSNFWPVVHDTIINGRKSVKKILLNIYKNMISNTDIESEDYKKEFEKHLSLNKNTNLVEALTKIEVVHNKLTKEYKNAHDSIYRSEYNFDVSVAFYPYKGDVYIRPFCDMLMSKSLDFLNDDKRIREFRYWNNTDRPDDITDRQWNERAKVWDGIFKEYDIWDMVSTDICTYDMFYKLSPRLELLEAAYKKHKVGP